MGAGDVVVLVDVDFAIGGDRAQFQVVVDAVRQVGVDALGIIDAPLLRHADVGDLHNAVAVDLNEGGQGADGGGDAAHRGDAGRGPRHDRQPVGVEVQQLAVERGVLVLADVGGQVGGEVGGRGPAHLGAHAATVIGAKALLARQRVIGDGTLVRDHAVDLDREVADGGEVDVQFAAVGIQIANAGARPHAELARRLARHQRQGAAFGIAAKQGALRALQDFDAFNIQKSGAEAVLAAQIDAVDIDANALLAGGLVGVVRHDAANTDGQGRLARFKGGDAQAGHGTVSQVHQALHMAVFQRFAVHHRDGDRRLLQIGGALGRRHHHVGQLRLGHGVSRGHDARSGLFRHRRVGRRLGLTGQSEGKRRQRNGRCKTYHLGSPPRASCVELMGRLVALGEAPATDGRRRRDSLAAVSQRLFRQRIETTAAVWRALQPLLLDRQPVQKFTRTNTIAPHFATHVALHM
ncbi:hypothetical protein D3C87_1217010 [compost metagenome]